MIECGGSTNQSALDFRSRDDGSSPIPPLHFHVEAVPARVARMHVEQWHYSRRMPTGKNLCYGLFADGQLYAVIVYGIGVNPYQARFLGVHSVLEIKRMCRSEPRIDVFPLSRFISVSHRMCRKVFPHDCLIAFADPEHGHEGTVYRASGFTHHGMTNAEWHVLDGSGFVRHRRYAFRHARRNGISIKESRKILGLTRVQSKPKHRYVRQVESNPL